jgi:hypothetical protein
LFIVVFILAAASAIIIRSLTSPDSTHRDKPLLILQQSASGAVDDDLPLGALVVDDETVDATLEIRGLPVGMTISSGRRTGMVWRIPAANAVNAKINPPTGFSGTVDLTVELRLRDDTIADFGSAHREWLQRPKVVSNAQPGTDERHTTTASASAKRNERHTATASASAKRKRVAVHSRIHALPRRNDRDQVHYAGRRVGADPDLNIRRTLARQYTWVN